MDSSTMEIFTLKDAFWKLSTRVAVIENFISEKFGASAFSVVQEKLEKAKNSTETNEEHFGKTQSAQSEKPGPSSKKKTVKTNTPAIIKRKSTAEQKTQSSPTTEKKRKVAKRINYKEEDSDYEGTSSDGSDVTNESFEIDTSPPDLTAVSAIKIENDEFDRLGEEHCNEMSSIAHEGEDESQRPLVQSEGRKDKNKKTTQKPKPVSIEWTYCRRFGEAKEAQDFLRNQWVYRNTNKNQTGSVSYFHCKEGGKSCPAAAKLQYVKTIVHLWMKKCDHNHEIGCRLIEHGLTADTKKQIIELLEDGITKPNHIINVLTERQLTAPSKAKLVNFLHYYRKSTNPNITNPHQLEECSQPTV